MPLPIYLKVVLVQLIIVVLLTLLPNTIVTHFLHDFFGGKLFRLRLEWVGDILLSWVLVEQRKKNDSIVRVVSPILYSLIVCCCVCLTQANFEREQRQHNPLYIRHHNNPTPRPQRYIEYFLTVLFFVWCTIVSRLLLFPGRVRKRQDERRKLNHYLIK